MKPQPSTFVPCSICGGTQPPEVMHHLDDQPLCPACAQTHTLTCVNCGETIWREDNAGDDDTPLCEACRNYCYTACTHCGRVIHQDDAYYYESDEDGADPYCYHCYHDRRGIQDYYCKPDPIFYSTGPRYFGVELEIDGAGESDRNADAILDIANVCHEHIYCKHDGSLRDGFEIVTHPMSLDYHMKEMSWREVLRKAISMGYGSHREGTCGLHVHVSRNAFGNAYNEQEAVIARILYFVEWHWEELLRFSRRTQSQLDRWAARYGYKEQPKDILDHAKRGCHAGRYTCVNLENYSTIEFRIFRGTLKYNTLIATLQLVNQICDVAISLSDEKLKALTWTDFVAGIDRKKYPELVQYLKERRLYVNAPVRGEAEV